MELTKSQEEYIKSIYILENVNKEVRVTDIANKLSVSKPSVTKSLKNLAQNNLVNYETYSTISLTDKGKKIAKDIIARQDMLKNFLCEILDVEEKKAEKEAEYLKYYLSKDTIKKIDEHVSNILDLGKSKCKCNEKDAKCKTCLKYTMKKKVENRRIKC